MMFSLLIEIGKRLHPIRWLRDISKEIDQVPATISSVLLLWVTVVTFGLWAYFTYTDNAEAAEQRDAALAVQVADLKTVVSRNTKELDCSRQDRAIASKTREIDTASRLLLRADDESEEREIKRQIVDLQRELDNMTATYKAHCLMGV